MKKTRGKKKSSLGDKKIIGVPPSWRQEGEKKMEMNDLFYINYNDQIELDGDMILIAAWNEYTAGDKGSEIFMNDKEFFENSFKNPYDAALAVSLSDKWQWEDRFVYFSHEGQLTSFSHWDDANSPIDIDKIDISNLINDLKRCRGKKGI